MKVRIGIGLGTRTRLQGPEFGHVVDTIERLGFDSLWLSERISGEAPDPVVAMAYAAGRTTRLKFGMSVLVLPGRNPVVLAKELATLAVMSGGRLLPAFGLGVADGVEHQAFGVERGERATWFDEALTVHAQVLVRRRRRARRRALPLRGPAGAAAAGPPRRVARRHRPVRAAARRADGRRLAAVVRHPRRRRGRSRRDRAGRRRARPGDRGRPLRRADPLHAGRRPRHPAGPAGPAPARPRRPGDARAGRVGRPDRHDQALRRRRHDEVRRPPGRPSRPTARRGTPTSPTPPTALLPLET